MVDLVSKKKKNEFVDIRSFSRKFDNIYSMNEVYILHKYTSCFTVENRFYDRHYNKCHKI